MKLKTICRAVALIAAMSAGVAHAEGLSLGHGASLYGMIGPSDAGYSNSGVGLKVGADFASGLLGVRELGLTGFYAYTGASNDYYLSSCSKWNVSNHSFALGPTFTVPLQGTKLSFQGRAYGSMNLWRVSAGCAQWDTSGSEFDIGYGFGAQYQLNSSVSLRVDWDSVGWNASMFSVGVGVKF